MIDRTIEWCIRNGFLVILALAAIVIAGTWSLERIPLDALPDISDVQVIVHTRWMGRPPGIIEDQITYPIVATMLGAPRVKAVRAQTMPNDSYVYVVFNDGTDVYWARSRVLEYLQQVAGRLPTGIVPELGPDASGAGWIYEYALLDRSHRLNLAELRSLQDWTLRYALQTVPGVAEVASIGGFVREYQVKLDPHRLYALHIPLSAVIDKIRDSNNEVGGRILELSGASYLVRGLGYIRSLSDLEQIPVATHNGTPILLRDLGSVSFGSDLREGAAEWNGEGETVGGIVVMRQGQNALNVIKAVKRKLAEIAPSLPPSVRIVAGYDRSGLIQGAINTLERDLIEEAAIVSAVIIIFLFHFRSALIPILSIPLALLASFVPMYLLGASSNIMSLGGFALAIGVLVDASIVMVENGHRHLAAAASAGPIDERERHRTLLDAACQVGRPIFYSLLIIVISFLPVFLLEAQEGRLFRPLAWTKTLAVAFSSLVAIAVVPLLMLMLVRGKRLRTEAENPVASFFNAIYLPIIRWCLRHRTLTIAANALLFLVVVPLALTMGSQFMPPLFEGSVVYMPTALPGLPLSSGIQLMQEQDRILRAIPEVESVFGTVGRADSATDNAPTDMFDTTVILRPKSRWRGGMTYPRLIQEMDSKLDFPGLSNSWTMPVENRLDMELTGIKTPVGLKIQGPELARIEQIGSQIEEILQTVPGTRSVFAERPVQGFYIDIKPNRAAAARYGLTVADVQEAVTSAIGGDTVSIAVSGRERVPINVRYFEDYRRNPEALRAVLLTTPEGVALPLGEVATVGIARGASMIRDEDGELTGYVYLDLGTSDYGGYVRRARRVLDARLKLPAGYRLRWSGEYSFQLRARERMMLILPMVLGVILLLLYMLFASVLETFALVVPCVYALTGGLVLQYAMGFNFSVAVAVGYIALFGIAVETGVVMIIYLDEALDLRLHRGPVDRDDIFAATLEGAAHRLRPKLMTVAVVIMSLVPILWESGIGADVMKPIAAPIVGGMMTSAIAVLVLVPVLFTMIKERALRRGTLRPSGMRLVGEPSNPVTPHNERS